VEREETNACRLSCSMPETESYNRTWAASAVNAGCVDRGLDLGPHAGHASIAFVLRPVPAPLRLRSTPAFTSLPGKAETSPSMDWSMAHVRPNQFSASN
jgi:hypothetical protein